MCILREVGTIVRSLKCCPTEGELHDILAEVGVVFVKVKIKKNKEKVIKLIGYNFTIIIKLLLLLIFIYFR